MKRELKAYIEQCIKDRKHIHLWYSEDHDGAFYEDKSGKVYEAYKSEKDL